MGRLADAAASAQPLVGGVKSLVDAWLETLDDEDRADALALLTNPARIGHSPLSRLIREVHGVRFSPSVILRWREKQRG